METTSLTLVQRELELLEKYLKGTGLTDFNKKKLRAELATAKIVKDALLPTDVVCLNSVVHIQDKLSEQKFTFQIVLPSESDFRNNKVSIFAPVAVALIGYREGTSIQWEMPGGMQEFEILTVNQVGVEPTSLQMESSK